MQRYRPVANSRLLEVHKEHWSFISLTLTRIHSVGHIRSNIVLNCIKSSTETLLAQLSGRRA